MYLLDGPGGEKKRSFKSVHDGLRTDWHGTWIGHPAVFDDRLNLRVQFNFDWRGRHKHAEEQCHDVALATSWTREGCRYKETDYTTRSIMLIFTRTWHFDEYVSATSSRRHVRQ